MPYVPEPVRGLLDNEPVDGVDPHGPGQLNYVLTRICLNYVLRRGQEYQSYNDVLGALEGAKQEFYRRGVAPYEDRKRAENGDL